MSMTIYVQAFKEADADYKAKLAAYNACAAANIEIPEELLEYFDDTNPNESPNGLEIDISRLVEKKSVMYADVREIELAKLPAGITHLRFCISY